MSGGKDLQTEALHELASLGAREWEHPGRDDDATTPKASPKHSGFTDDEEGSPKHATGRKRKTREQENSEADFIMIDDMGQHVLENGGMPKAPTKPPNVAPGFPVTMRLGQTIGIDLKGWSVPAEGEKQAYVTVIAGNLQGQDCVGICGADLTPPLIAASLNKMLKFPKLIPQLKVDVDPADISALLAVRDVIIQNRTYITEMVETRMKEFLRYPAEDKIVTITHLLAALYAASAEDHDYSSLVHSKESLLRVSALVIGTAKTRDIVAQNMGNRHRESNRPSPIPTELESRPKRPKLYDPIVPSESPKISSWRNRSPYTSSATVSQPLLVFPEITRLTSKEAKLVQPPKRVTNKLHEAIVVVMRNPVLRKLFYYDSNVIAPEGSLPPLKLRMDLNVSVGRRLAYELTFPKTSDPTTWKAKVIGAYVPDSSPPEQAPKFTALKIVDRPFKVEFDPSKLSAHSEGRAAWNEFIGLEVDTNEKDMTRADLVVQTSKLIGLNGESKPPSASNISPMRMLQIPRQDVRVSFTMRDSDKSSDSEALVPFHPVGATKNYTIAVNAGPRNPNIEMEHAERVAATFSSRRLFIDRLGQAVKATRKPPQCRDEPEGEDDFDSIPADGLQETKSEEAMQ